MAERDVLSQIDLAAETPLDYCDFRTYLTFSDVYHIMYHRKWKRRHSVLGYWRELKQKMYRDYCEMFYYAKQRSLLDE